MKYKTVTEGSVKIKIADEEKISKDLPVFYNPVMKLNRDISISLLNSVDKENMQIGLPLSGSGVRGLRFFKELDKKKVKAIYLNDLDTTSFRQIKSNLKLNKINSKKITVENKDANLFMLNSKGFDYIDIDPFGSPNKFLNSAMDRLSRNSILAVTATDTAPLCGTFPSACLRKYWARPLLNELMHEIGLRILIRKVQLIGAQHDKALRPIFSYYKDHYFRIIFHSRKGKQRVDEQLKEHGYLTYCCDCMGSKVVTGIFNTKKCDCGSKLDYAGPLYVGKLFDPELINKIFNSVKNNKELYNFLKIIKEESKIERVGFYDLHQFCKKHKLTIPKLDLLINKIKKKNKVARTHFCDVGIRSDIGLNELIKLIKSC
jgi:tRNA (guanine26-N2/guanine27-N2)-dimethyltransferase